MTTNTATTRYGFGVGEEVVVNMRDVAAYDVECGHPASTCCSWTIAAITGRSGRDGRPAYVVRFRHHGSVCVAVVDETAIEGTA